VLSKAGAQSFGCVLGPGPEQLLGVCPELHSAAFDSLSGSVAPQVRGQTAGSRRGFVGWNWPSPVLSGSTRLFGPDRVRAGRYSKIHGSCVNYIKDVWSLQTSQVQLTLERPGESFWLLGIFYFSVNSAFFWFSARALVVFNHLVLKTSVFSQLKKKKDKKVEWNF